MNLPCELRPGGYAWWYFDAVSDCGQRALTAIFFIGSVFSPDYAARVRRGERPRPEEHLAVNLALYERGRPRAWVMSEYGPAALGPLSAAGPTIGASAVAQGPDGGWRIRIDERAAPFLVTLAGVGPRVVGDIELEPQAPPSEAAPLSRHGERHLWQVRAPRGRVRVRFSRPDFAFDGLGYHDLNAGEGRLEAAFTNWSWARFHPGGRTTILYATRGRDGVPGALLVDAADHEPAQARRVELVAEGERRRAPWGLSLPRSFAVDDGQRLRRVRVERLIETAPFYVRYLASLEGDEGVIPGVGEFLDLERFRSPAIQFLLRFKMRRR